MGHGQLVNLLHSQSFKLNNKELVLITWKLFRVNSYSKAVRYTLMALVNPSFWIAEKGYCNSILSVCYFKLYENIFESLWCRGRRRQQSFVCVNLFLFGTTQAETVAFNKIKQKLWTNPFSATNTSLIRQKFCNKLFNFQWITFQEWLICDRFSESYFGEQSRCV